MGFDIRAIFTRALGGRLDAVRGREPPAPEEVTDEEAPGSPIEAAGSAAAAPDADDLTTGGATAASALLVGGLDAVPTAALDDTTSSEDEYVDDEQAQAIAQVAVAASLVEGPLGDEEVDDLVESLQQVPGLTEFDLDAFEDLVADLGRSEDESSGAYVSRMEGWLEDLAPTLGDVALRRAAYELAVYFCAWDGEISDAERDFLTAAAEAFEMDAEEARYLRAATLQELGVQPET